MARSSITTTMYARVSAAPRRDSKNGSVCPMPPTAVPIPVTAPQRGQRRNRAVHQAKQAWLDDLQGQPALSPGRVAHGGGGHYDLLMTDLAEGLSRSGCYLELTLCPSWAALGKPHGAGRRSLGGR